MIRTAIHILLSVALLISASATSADTDVRKVVIAFTNDFESAYDPIDAYWREDIDRIGGIAELATLVNKLRDQNDVVFLFDAGDIFTGTLAKRTHGAVSFDLMGLIGYDAIAIGNHEFEYGWEVLAEQKNRVTFPVLGANLFYKDTRHPYAQPWTIVERGGVRVGVVGVMGQDAGTALIPSNIAGVTVLPPIDVVAPIVKRLRNECDLVVVLTHQGLTAPMQTDDEADQSVFRGNEANLALAGRVPGIDAVLGGHTDAGTREPLMHPETGGVVMQTFGQGQHVGVLEFEISDGGAEFVDGELLTVNADELTPDPIVAARLARYRAAHPDLYDSVGVLAGDLTRRYYGESTMGNAFADIVADAADAPIGLMPSGALRRDIASGPVRSVDLLDAFPFEDRVARVQLSGTTLLRVLEQGLSLDRGFLQISGLQVTYDADRPVGDRVIEVWVGDTLLDAEAAYMVAALEIMAQGGDQYTQFKDADSVEWIDGSFADYLLRTFADESSVRAPETGRYRER